MKLTKKEWDKFTLLNNKDSYSYAVSFVILMLWEAGVKNEEQAGEEIRKYNFGLSGAQAMMAIQFALKYEEPDWLDKEMVGVSRV